VSVFGRKKTLNDELAAQTEADQAARPGAKNRPTPKRRDQEALNKRPLIVTDRKAASKQDKTARREAMAKQRAGMLVGDEKYLPVRDKGPRRRFIRDSVDARWNIGEFMLPIMLIVLLLSFVRTSWALLLVFVLVYGLILVAIGDAVLMWRRTRRKVEAKFGHAEKGDAWYAIMRAFQMRRTRMPKPQVGRGEHPA
jgi:Flp pilus assembly protein TadB